MGIDTSQLVDYSWDDIAKAAKMAMMNATLGGANLTINGRSIGRLTPAQAQRLYEFATEQQQRSSSTTGSLTALGKFENPS